MQWKGEKVQTVQRTSSKCKPVQKAETMTQQDFQPIDVDYSAVHSEDTVQDTVQSENCTVQSDLYTVGQLETLLGVKKRMIFTYAKVICEVHHWEPEITFKPVFGKYSQRALDEMKKLKEMGTEEYSKKTPKENQKPSTGITGGLTILTEKIKSDSTSTLTLLETKIADQQSLAVTEINQSVEDLKKLNADLALRRKRSAEVTKGKREARLARLKARAVAQALEDFHAVQEVYNATLEELEAQELGE